MFSVSCKSVHTPINYKLHWKGLLEVEPPPQLQIFCSLSNGFQQFCSVFCFIYFPINSEKLLCPLNEKYHSMKQTLLCLIVEMVCSGWNTAHFLWLLFSNIHFLLVTLMQRPDLWNARISCPVKVIYCTKYKYMAHFQICKCFAFIFIYLFMLRCYASRKLFLLNHLNTALINNVSSSYFYMQYFSVIFICQVWISQS